jgi:group I intron endonuclease
MKYSIYKLTNTADNGKSYIGLTTDTKARWNKCLYRGTRIKLAIDKFGWNNFKKQVLAQADDLKIASELEIHFIEKYRTVDPDFGYNAQRGGSYSRSGIKRKASTTKRQRATMHKIRWYYNPMTNETIRVLPEIPVPNGFVPGRGTFRPTNPFGHNS